MDWSFYDEPSLDEDAKIAVGSETLPKGPWIFDVLDRKVKRPQEYQGDDTEWPPSGPTPPEATSRDKRASEQTMVAALATNEDTMKQVLGEQHREQAASVAPVSA